MCVCVCASFSNRCVRRDVSFTHLFTSNVVYLIGLFCGSHLQVSFTGLFSGSYFQICLVGLFCRTLFIYTRFFRHVCGAQHTCQRLVCIWKDACIYEKIAFDMTSLLTCVFSYINASLHIYMCLWHVCGGAQHTCQRHIYIWKDACMYEKTHVKRDVMSNQIFSYIHVSFHIHTSLRHVCCAHVFWNVKRDMYIWKDAFMYEKTHVKRDVMSNQIFSYIHASFHIHACLRHVCCAHVFWNVKRDMYICKDTCQNRCV